MNVFASESGSHVGRGLRGDLLVLPDMPTERAALSRDWPFNASGNFPEAFFFHGVSRFHAVTDG
ncbi:MAG: hypothetical protein C4316_12715 [Chloroflexota bacterium]